MRQTHEDSGAPVAARRLSVAITRLRSRLREEAGMHATGLSISQLAVLQSVVDDGPTTAAHLAQVQHVSAQSVAQNLAVLKAAGLVRGERDPADGRKTLISPPGRTRPGRRPEAVRLEVHHPAVCRGGPESRQQLADRHRASADRPGPARPGGKHRGSGL
jgi:MarR family